MKRIRSKLVLALLVVALIPVLPSYYMANGLVNHLMSLGFNDTVEGVIDGALMLATELRGQYETEVIQVAQEAAGSEQVLRLLQGTQETGADLEGLLPWPSGQIEIYDSQARLLASHSRQIEPLHPTTLPPQDRKHGSDISDIAVTFDDGHVASIDGPIQDLVASLLAFDGEPDHRFYRDSLDVLASMASIQVLPHDADPRLIAVLAPVVDAGLGFIVITHTLPADHGRTMWQLRGLLDLSQSIDEHRTQIQMVIRVVFWLFYAFVIFVALLIGYLLSRRLTKPLLSLVDGTKKVAAGDLDYQLDVASKDEIGQVMTSFNQMTTQIKVNQRLAAEREVQRQRMEDQHGARVKDLELAQMRERTLQAENERQTIELQKSQELERAYGELEAAHQELKETQAQLLMKEKMAALGGLVAGVAHEINNPMGAVHSAVDVSLRCTDRIRQGLDAAATLEEAKQLSTQRPMTMLQDNLGVIGQAAQRIVTLVQGLKNFARIDEAQMQMADLNEGIDSTLVLLQAQTGPGIQVERELSEIPRTWCAPGQLNQVFMSVLTNAVTAVGEAGLIKVTTAQSDNVILVRFTDDGIGMSSEQLERIFDLQFRAGAARVKMGSGLSMAYRIMQEHGGEILVDSQPGEGTQVTLRLPLRHEHETAGETTTAKEPGEPTS